MRDRRRGSDDSQRWVSTYSDVVTLLLAFFVLLFAMSEVDEERFDQLVAGLEDPFGNPGRVDLLPASDGVLDGQRLTVTAPPLTTTTTEATEKEEKGKEAAPEEPPLIVDQSELVPVQERLEEALYAAGFEDAADFRINERGLVVSIATDGLLFPSGSAELRPEGEQVIDVVAPELLDIANPVQVEGHTDNVPYAAVGYDNWNLSSDRSLAVLHLLIDGHEMDPRRLAATGYASFRPLQSNDDAEGRASNRRVELVILVNGES